MDLAVSLTHQIHEVYLERANGFIPIRPLDLSRHRRNSSEYYLELQIQLIIPYSKVLILISIQSSEISINNLQTRGQSQTEAQYIKIHRAHHQPIRTGSAGDMFGLIF